MADPAGGAGALPAGGDERPRSALSAQFINPFTAAVLGVSAVVSAYFEQGALALFLGFACAFFLCAWLWGRASVKRLDYSLHLPAVGVFPGQKFTVERTIKNDKLLPLIWLELTEPCLPNGCALPEERFLAEDPLATEETPDEERYFCLYAFTLLKWKQTLRFSDEWTARRRGIHPIPSARIRSGDGFGLVVAARTFSFEAPRRMVVYPALVPVAEEKVLQEMWDSRSRTSGYLEDITLLRSVRPYQRGDAARRINQRMLARGQGLQVNQYQVVTPDSVLFLFDAPSFAGAPQALEEALSVLASLLTALRRRGVAVGLALGRSSHFPASCVAPTGDEQALWPMLELLAAVGAGDEPPARSLPVPAPELIGRTYYIAHSVGAATALSALAPFPPHKAQLLTWLPGQPPAGLPVRPLGDFRREGGG